MTFNSKTMTGIAAGVAMVAAGVLLGNYLIHNVDAVAKIVDPGLFD